MVDEFEELKERAEALVREGYRQAIHSGTKLATMPHVAPKLGLDPANLEDEEEFRKAAEYAEDEDLSAHVEVTA